MAAATRRSGNLPAEVTTFVGRRRELAEVRTKLAHGRLVSLVGPGGVGKTRLAIRIAADLARGFRGGGWLAELGEISEPPLVSSAVMAALGLRDQAAAEPLALLLSYLRDKELLLVVDNCEHLLGTAAQVVADIMRTAPGVRVLATSREPLAIPGEQMIPVPPLELPQDTGPLARLRQNEAVMLFTERAAAASGRFGLTDANRAAVVGLCHRLDGLPLAIELAAVKTRVLSAEQILDRLTDRFGLLSGGNRAALPRHQALLATIEWSHDLLTGAERAVLRRLSVFAGKFSLEDVESVCTSGDMPVAQALDLLSSLVDKSLVMREDARGLACYRLHETMREFTRLKLAHAGETEATEQRCAAHYRASSQRSARDRRYRLVEWLEWADLEIDNIRAVLQRALKDGDTATGIDIAFALGWYWVTRATTEGMRWLDGFLAAGGGDPVARAGAHFMHGFLAVLKGDPAAARPALRAAVAACQEAGLRGLLSEALSLASIAESLAGNRPAAAHLVAEADVIAGGLAYPPGRLAVLQARSLNGLLEADLPQVRSSAAEGARLARASGDLYGLEMMLLNQGVAELIAGRLDESRPPLAEALQIAGQIDDAVAQFYLLGALGCHAAVNGQARRAARLLGAADTARTRVGANVMPFLAPSLARATASAAATLGAARFEAEFETGKQLSLEAALELALDRHSSDAAAARDDGAGPLGKREAEVARLVADGLTNKQIGSRLLISERTVDSHVRSILNRLGFSSRTQIAAWITSPHQ
jgi:predicted ATPase/DNA-binding CsgD family transcriptional regulator